MTYTPVELMIACASHALEDGRTVAVGTGVPCAAAMLAQKTHAPNLVICFEAGGVAPQLPTMPISVGDSRTIHKAVMATSMAEVMQFCQRGMMDYTFLSGAQIDPYGNLNSTQIGGTHQKPKVRLPGSGGACDLASFCWRTLMIMRHDRKKFVEKLDFLTSPGYLTGPGAREAAGLPKGTGPHRVITELAVLDFHPTTRRMRLLSLHPGVSIEQVHAATGFQFEESESVGQTAPPTDAELQVLRQEVDPAGYVLRRAG
ncbi:MAG TPA: CoA-transferase [Gemmataceae bacterium]|jgi:glutaconate CoA-transferase subunit B|nr:CoA-transferase [Gemmataceae bacterium]